MAEGNGRANLAEGEEFSFNGKDTLAIPGWTWRSFRAETDAFLFFFSDRVVHEKLGFYREERKPA